MRTAEVCEVGVKNNALMSWCAAHWIVSFKSIGVEAYIIAIVLHSNRDQDTSVCIDTFEGVFASVMPLWYS